MTNDEKAKAYDMALETARKINSGEGVPAPSGWTKLEVIFPQLRESEDEQSRKKIEQLIRLNTSGAEKTQLLAYLEKQKEQVTDESDKIAAAYQLGRSDERKQKEQKPAEKQDYSGLNDLERAIHRGFLCAGVKNVPVTIIKDTAAECMGFLALIEPKPAEWSKGDEKILNELLDHCNTENATWYDWLNSLRPPFKDREMKLKILKYLSTRCSSLEFEEVEDYLNNLRPSWKPSEEQMDALTYDGER